MLRSPPLHDRPRRPPCAVRGAAFSLPAADAGFSVDGVSVFTARRSRSAVWGLRGFRREEGPNTGGTSAVGGSALSSAAEPAAAASVLACDGHKTPFVPGCGLPAPFSRLRRSAVPLLWYAVGIECSEAAAASRAAALTDDAVLPAIGGPASDESLLLLRSSSSPPPEERVLVSARLSLSLASFGPSPPPARRGFGDVALPWYDVFFSAGRCEAPLEALRLVAALSRAAAASADGTTTGLPSLFRLCLSGLATAGDPGSPSVSTRCWMLSSPPDAGASPDDLSSSPPPAPSR